MFYGIPTGWSWQELDRLLTSIKKFDKSYDIYIINNNPGFQAIEDVISKHLDWACDIKSFGKNIGVAAAWNKLCELAWECGYERAILLNDDMVFTNDSYIDNFSDASADTIILDKNCSYACFCLTRNMWDRVGRFDEANYAYYEDNDYHYRRKLLNIEYSMVETGAVHGIDGQGSRTIKNDSFMAYQNTKCFPVAQQYYVAKWGGLPDQEQFVVPFNGNEAARGSIYMWEQGGLL